jgi:hypothetical protein
VGALWKGFSAAMARAVPANVSFASKRDIIERTCEDGEADVLCFDRVVTGRYVCRCRVVVTGYELAVVDEGVLGRLCSCKQGTGNIWVAKGASDVCRDIAPDNAYMSEHLRYPTSSFHKASSQWR